MSSKPNFSELQRGLLFHWAKTGVGVRIKWNKEEKAELSCFPRRQTLRQKLHVGFGGGGIMRNQ